jgi:hypothetical protein
MDRRRRSRFKHEHLMVMGLVGMVATAGFALLVATAQSDTVPIIAQVLIR